MEKPIKVLKMDENFTKFQRLSDSDNVTSEMKSQILGTSKKIVLQVSMLGNEIRQG
jgi:hypothetical protein